MRWPQMQIISYLKSNIKTIVRSMLDVPLGYLKRIEPTTQSSDERTNVRHKSEATKDALPFCLHSQLHNRPHI